MSMHVKKFEEIVCMTQRELKSFLVCFIMSRGYSAINNDGYLYCVPKEKNKINVLVTAHMDTVHKEIVKEIHKVPYRDKDNKLFTKISSPQGIGGDDRCGIWMIMQIVNQGLRPYILFCEDEEIGCVGARKFSASNLINDVKANCNYIIELDRRGKNDAVYYSNDNKDFQEWITKNTGYKTATGSCSDISKLMPTANLAGVNFSCGYYQEHTLQEYVIEEEMKATMNMVAKLLKVNCTRFEYIEKKYDFNWHNFNDYSYYGNYNTSSTVKKGGNTKFHSDTEVKLIAIIDDGYNSTCQIESTGATKPECWMNLFMENDILSFSDIIDYNYE